MPNSKGKKHKGSVPPSPHLALHLFPSNAPHPASSPANAHSIASEYANFTKLPLPVFASNCPYPIWIYAYEDGTLTTGFKEKGIKLELNKSMSYEALVGVRLNLSLIEKLRGKVGWLETGFVYVTEGMEGEEGDERKS